MFDVAGGEGRPCRRQALLARLPGETRVRPNRVLRSAGVCTWTRNVRAWKRRDRTSARTSRAASLLVLVERCELGPRLGTREDTRPTCRRGRLIPEDARPSPNYPDEHLQGRKLLSYTHRSNLGFPVATRCPSIQQHLLRHVSITLIFLSSFHQIHLYSPLSLFLFVSPPFSLHARSSGVLKFLNLKRWILIQRVSMNLQKKITTR